MPVHFVLKRFLPGFEEYGDLYEAIKTGKKTVEYRDDTWYWANRLLSTKGLKLYNSINYRNSQNDLAKTVLFSFDLPELLKHTKATFRVGYTKGPTLHATIKKIIWKVSKKQFEIHIENVTETQQ